MKKVLQCHSQGDIRFSAYGAIIEIDCLRQTIEHHYQLSKRFYGEPLPKEISDAKGRDFHFFELHGIYYPKEMISSYFELMWVKYFKDNPQLLRIAMQYDDFKDIFKGSSVNNQEDTIRRIVTLGIDAVQNEHRVFSELIKRKSPILIVDDDILNSKQDIIVHQVNCKGAMGAGLAKTLRYQFEGLYEAYKAYCVKNNKDFDLLMGQMFMYHHEKSGRYIANLFGQYNWGGETRQTDYKYLEKSLIKLKEYAIENHLSIAMPYEIGCGLAGGDWEKVKDLIINIFYDYPVVFYKKPNKR